MKKIKKQIADALEAFRAEHEVANPTSAEVVIVWNDDEDKEEYSETISLVPEDECEHDDEDVVYYSSVERRNWLIQQISKSWKLVNFF